MVDNTTLQNTNFLQPTGYKVVINRKKFANLEFFAQSISHPDVSMAPAVTPFRQVDAFQPGDKLEYSELTIMAILDESMFVYQEVFKWMEELVQTSQIRGNRLRIDPGDSPFFDVTVSVLNSSNNVVRNIVYKDAFPTNIGTIEFTSTIGDVQGIIMPITMRYTQFTFT